MNLSPHFTLAELTKSQTALRNGIDNSPPPQAIQSLIRLSELILEPVRQEFGPFSPSSGYRSPELNQMIGGSATSQHKSGEAADFEVPGVSNLELAWWIRDNCEFDQLILEYHDPNEPNSGWVHCSISEAPRREVLTKNTNFYMRGLPERTSHGNDTQVS